ncbi:MAG: helix-turn-helix domain-containing protein [bacterium]|nr:helix-turn-helix domain-containing protein [bacterium]
MADIEKDRKSCWQQVGLTQEVVVRCPNCGTLVQTTQATKPQVEAQEMTGMYTNAVHIKFPRWQKDRVESRLKIILETLDMTRSKLQDYINTHNRNLSLATIYRWRKAYIEGGKNALMTGYGRTKGRSIIPDDVFKVFLSAYMSDKKPSSSKAYRIAIGYWQKKENGKIEKFPSQATFEYRLKHDPDASAMYLARYGKAAWERKYRSSMDEDH